jgi:hypothetical protein
MFNSSDKVTVGQLLFPVCLIALIVFSMLAFQTTQIVRERHMLNQTLEQQAPAVEQAQKVDAQLNALAAGTAKLAEKGDKNAEVVVAGMKRVGITLGPQPAPAAPAGKPASASVPVTAPPAPATP